MTLATGGTVNEAGGYRVHTFNSSADLIVSVAGDVEYVLIGGGGGGGRNNAANSPGGGGGGGAVKTGSASLAAATFPVVIGGGGAGFQTDGTFGLGITGTASTFNGVTAGGGGGGARNAVAGVNAVDGGGGGGGGATTSAGSNPAGGTSTGGFAGGAGFGATLGTERAGGGGGGAGAVGTAGAINVGGAGGAGVQSDLSGAATYYGGGGGGAAGPLDTRGAAGLGSGTASLLQGETGYPNCADNTGGGGGSGGGLNGAGGGNGGSGKCIVRYPAALTVTDAGDELFLNGDSVSVAGTNFLAAQGTGRVVLSPSNNIADAGAVDQTVTAWADTAVMITVVVGSLTKGVTVYLFVENNLDASNATGRPVVLVATPVTITNADDELFNDAEAVTITGTLFMASQGVGRVVLADVDDIDDASAVIQTVNTWSATSIAITTVKGSLPAGVTLYLFVENQHGSSNAAGYNVEFFATPLTISDAGDELYFNGDSVTISGANFLVSQGAGRVVISPANDINHVDALEQTVTSWGNTEIEITIVKGLLLTGLPHWLFVENNQGTVNASGFPVQFQTNPVTISNADDELFDAGDAVTITGTNFIPTQGSGKVYISGSDNVLGSSRVQQTVTGWSNTSINILAVQGALPAAPFPLYLFVINNQGLSNASGYPVQFAGAPVPVPEGEGEFGFIEGIEWIEVVE